MRNSLQEQLLKAGLVTEDQSTESRRADGRTRRREPKKAKKQRRREAGAGAVAETETGFAARGAHTLEVARQRAQKVARDRALNQKREAERERKARRAQVHQLLEAHAQSAADADLPYHFPRGKRIRRVHVTGAQRARLVAGELVIVELDAAHFLVEPEVAERARALAPDVYVYSAAVAQAAPQDDAYAEHPIPDDLMW